MEYLCIRAYLELCTGLPCGIPVQEAGNQVASF